MEILQFVVLDVFSDACHTAAHVAAHKIPCLRVFHAKHHKKIRPSAMDTFYNHPVDAMLMTGARIVVPLAILVPPMGIGVPVVVAFLFWAMFTEMSHHSTHPIAKLVSLGWIPGRAYPGHHLKHHLHPQYNYGENWVWWDKLMGTFAPSLELEDIDASSDQQGSSNARQGKVTVKQSPHDVPGNIGAPVELCHDHPGVVLGHKFAQEVTRAEG